MLKRAIFGILGPTGRRVGPCTAVEPSSDEDTQRNGESKRTRKAHWASKYPKESCCKNADSHNDTTDCGRIQSSGSEDEESPQDPKIRRALIRRAAALFAKDKRAFMQAMKKHESLAAYSEDSSCSEPELVDPTSESETGESSDDQNHPVNGGPDMEHSKGSTSGRKNTGKRDEPENFTRGKFHCILCPKKVFIFEADLEKHLQSKVHKKRELEWTRHQQQNEDEGKEVPNFASGDCIETGKTRAENAAKRNKTSDKMDSSVKVKKRWRPASTKRSQRRRDVETLSQSDIERRKKKFQEKKKRRLLRKQS